MRSYLPAVLTLIETALAASIDNIIAQYGPSPAPFTINVKESFINQTLAKVAATRYPDDLGQPAFVDGPTKMNATDVAEYWLDEYSWQETQAQLNSFYTQFTTTVRPTVSNYTEPIPLHFVHHRSNRPDAIPFLFVHGWPGSFMEVGRIINHLTNPPNSSVPAFHVVAPSIPGFGFSPAPIKDGFGPREAAHAFNALMLQLNYTRYVVQGGDFGAVILRTQTALYPDNVISYLSNFWLERPTANDLARLATNQATPDETTYMTALLNFGSNEAGYFHEQATLPLQLAYGMTDSPIGFTMWIYALMGGFSTGYPWTFSEIITWSMMYYIQGPYGGLRFYKEVTKEGFASLDNATMWVTNEFPFITETPVGITQRPVDLGWKLPLDWARRSADNVTKIYTHDQGGHFAAYQSPDTLLEDIWDFFGNASLSGVTRGGDVKSDR